MEIKKIQGIIISSIFVAGLAGCSNSSSWTEEDDSPWKAKRDAQTADYGSEEFVEVSLDEVAEVNSMEEVVVTEEVVYEPEMVESEMAGQPALESISDFDPEPVPVEELSAFERLERDSMAAQAEPEPVAETVEIETVDVASDVQAVDSDIMNASASAYAVQVYAGRKLENVNRYISTHGLDYMQIVKTDRDGDVIHVLVSIHDDRDAAVQEASNIEESTGSKPWVRSVAGLQVIAAQ